jgi:hypothetical protein
MKRIPTFNESLSTHLQCERAYAKRALREALRAIRRLWQSRPLVPPGRAAPPPMSHVDALERERRALRALGDGQEWHVDVNHDVSRAAMLGCQSCAHLLSAWVRQRRPACAQAWAVRRRLATQWRLGMMRSVPQRPPQPRAPLLLPHLGPL